jgi:hypothetical protein
MSIVLKGGEVKPGDAVCVELPPPLPHQPLAYVVPTTRHAVASCRCILRAAAHLSRHRRLHGNIPADFLVDGGHRGLPRANINALLWLNDNLLDKRNERRETR